MVKNTEVIFICVRDVMIETSEYTDDWMKQIQILFNDLIYYSWNKLGFWLASSNLAINITSITIQPERLSEKTSRNKDDAIV